MKFNSILETKEWDEKRASIRMNKFSDDKVLSLLKKLDQGSIKIEFMGQGKSIQLVVNFDSKISWLLNSDSKKKNTLHFSSVNSFISHIRKSINDIYDSDLKAVYREVFDPKEMEGIFRQLVIYADDYANKSKSLAFSKKDAVEGEKNTDWDMMIKFRRSTEKISKGEGWKIYPILTGKKDMGKIIAPNEQEVEWSQDKVKKFISSLK